MNSYNEDKTDYVNIIVLSAFIAMLVTGIAIGIYSNLDHTTPIDLSHNGLKLISSAKGVPDIYEFTDPANGERFLILHGDKNDAITRANSPIPKVVAP